LQKAYHHSEELYQYINALFRQDKYPEQLYRTCEGILNLSKKTDRTQFIKACIIGQDNSYYSYAFLKRILENKMTENNDEPSLKSLPSHNNIRGKQSYK
jgi:hypothetical protein